MNLIYFTAVIIYTEIIEKRENERDNEVGAIDEIKTNVYEH